ncbi:AMP-binding protein [Pseudomonas putida]
MSQQPVNDGVSALLAGHARQRGDDIALRFKHLGIWQVRSWSALAADVAHLAQALAGQGFSAASQLVAVSEGRAPALLLSLAAQWLGGSARLLDPHAAGWQVQAADADWLYVDVGQWLASLQRLPRLSIYAGGQAAVSAPGQTVIGFEHLQQGVQGRAPAAGAGQGFITPAQPAAPLEVARHLVASEGLTGHHEVLAGSRFASSTHVRLVLLPWLVAGLRLNIGETAATRAGDRREVAPSLLVGDAGQYARLYAEVVAREPLPGTLAHGVYRWGLYAGPGTGVLRRVLGHWLVRRPLLDVLGLGRVKLAWLDGPPLDAATARFFASLGIEPRHAQSQGQSCTGSTAATPVLASSPA